MLIKTYKVMLIPNNKQNTRLFACAHTARFAYNWALFYEQFAYDIGNDFMTDCDLRKVFTQLKQHNEYAWLANFSNNITKQAIKDACRAYKNFFEGRAKYPKYKSKHKSKPSFYVDTDKIQITAAHVKLEKLTTDMRKNKRQFNYVRLAEKNRIPTDGKYVNPRISYDGLHWWLTIGVEMEEAKQSGGSANAGIGIDMGIKDLAICSDGNTYANINKTTGVKHVTKRVRRLQRRISRKYIMNKKGGRYCKTKNIAKSEKQLLLLNRRLTNIRHNYLHQVTTEIINRKPRFIVLEDLNVNGMLKNRHLARAVQTQCFNLFYRQLEYKSKYNSIKFITTDRFFPSSKTCIKCGCIKGNLKLSDRTYVCNECGNVIDRDFQAALNLAHYGEQYIA